MSENIARQSTKRNVSTPLLSPPDPPSERRNSGFSSLASIALALFGLVLTVSMAVVHLRSPITVTPQDRIAKLLPFSSPFRIDNTGDLSIWVEHVYCYGANVRWNSVTMDRILERSHDWEQFTLQRNESKTILCNVLDTPTPPQRADIVIAVDYRPLPFLPWTFRKLARFKGAYADQWQWLRQPIGPIESETNRAIDRLSDTGRSRYAFKGGIQ
jgi:hypothetical protein